jgi:hypothetical protein
VLDTNNRVAMINYIDRAIDDAYRMGYRVHLNAELVNPYNKTVCPIGAVMLTRPKNPIHKHWMVIFMHAFSGLVHKEASKEPLAHDLGKTYRRLLIS